MSASPAQGMLDAAVPGQVPAGGAAGPPGRLARVRAAAAARGIPFPTIIATVAVVVLTYLAGKVLYRLRDVILLLFVAGFIALILNPLVVYVQRWIPRRGWAVAIVTVWAALVFVGLVLAFGYPLVNGLTHLAHRLPLYVRDAAAGHGWIGHLARRFHVETWAARNAPKLESLGTSLARMCPCVGAAGAIADTGLIGPSVVLVDHNGNRMEPLDFGTPIPQDEMPLAALYRAVDDGSAGGQKLSLLEATRRRDLGRQLLLFRIEGELHRARIYVVDAASGNICCKGELSTYMMDGEKR